MTKKTEPNYQEISEQLEAILARLQQPDIQVDDAVRLYEQGLALADALEKHLQLAENTITRLKAAAN
ncbi:MAG TPA: exodeoxyribonuclease VII small subunit [Candidatus Saccharimonadales bacterium]|jgi:exodeoxyribonuclease VII small subunit|nr:exodeoxyribonuclease VII small subunit [Candidatus Saccharimonadales bacterium]